MPQSWRFWNSSYEPPSYSTQKATASKVDFLGKHTIERTEHENCITWSTATNGMDSGPRPSTDATFALLSTNLFSTVLSSDHNSEFRNCILLPDPINLWKLLAVIPYVPSSWGHFWPHRQHSTYFFPSWIKPTIANFKDCNFVNSVWYTFLAYERNPRNVGGPYIFFEFNVRICQTITPLVFQSCAQIA